MTRPASTLRLLLSWLAVAWLVAVPGNGADNLLSNPGFELPLAPYWEKRTPENESRTLRRVEQAGRGGSAAAVLENLAPSYTRLRQGADRSIAVEPGSLIELSAWVRSEMTGQARIALQVYCMDKKYTPITGTLTNPVRFGRYFPQKFTYAEFVEHLKAVADASPRIGFEVEGTSSQGQPICSLNLGTPAGPLYFLYAAAHGSEWEPGYGLVVFAEQLAEGRLSDVVDLDRVAVKIVPLLNPSGYDARRRHNANGVDLNRQGEFEWERFQGRDSSGDGTWGPFDYDWKGGAPLTEPEAQVYRSIASRENLFCVLDFHGNTSAESNKLAVLPATARTDNGIRAVRLQQIANARLRGRHLLQQDPEQACRQYLLERVQQGGRTPFLMNHSAKDRYGLLIELTAGYASSYGTVLQTDVTCELCRALFEAYPPDK